MDLITTTREGDNSEDMIGDEKMYIMKQVTKNILRESVGGIYAQMV